MSKEKVKPVHKKPKPKDSEANKSASEKLRPFPELQRKIFIHLISFSANLGIFFLLIGICSEVLASDRLYVLIFGILCLLQIINGGLFYLFFGKNNSTVKLVMCLLNLAWIVAAIVLFIVYKMWMVNYFFDEDVVFQFSLLFYTIIGIGLGYFYYVLNDSNDALTTEKSTESSDSKSVQDSKDQLKDTKKSTEEAKQLTPKDKNKNDDKPGHSPKLTPNDKKKPK